MATNGLYLNHSRFMRIAMRSGGCLLPANYTCEYSMDKLCVFKSHVNRFLLGKHAPPSLNISCKVLIVGGGAGGCSVAWRLSRSRTFKQNEIIVIEPSQVHFNQPQFTLVAGGIKQFKDTFRPTGGLLPASALWLRDSVEDFDPCNNAVYTASGDKVTYDFMLVAVGIQNDYEQIPGLEEALDRAASPVTTIYSPIYCVKSWRLVRQFRGGLAVFTRPRRGGKCSGAAHCVTYLADHYWRKKKVRPQTSMMYVTGDDVAYGVEKYAAALCRVAAARDVAVNYNMELAEITPRGAVFVDKDKGAGSITLPYTFLHVTPPMRAPTCLLRCSELVSEEGYLDVHRRTLQHRSVPNVFGIGDCLATPNSKTAAAVARQSPVVFANLSSVMAGTEARAQYDGYGACPILTSYGSGILAEFLYDKQVCETFPFDQSKESRFLYNLKKDVFPYLYWNKLLKGKWDGPGNLRRIINPFGR